MNTDKPVVSVLMTAYNHEKYISKAINSIINQETCYPFELIISDDCSEDKTRVIIEEYRKRYPSIIKVANSNVNLGICENQLKLELSAKGEFIAYCEGDDYWHNKTKLQKQVNFLKNNSDYGLVHSFSKAYNVSTGKLKNGIILKDNLNDDNAYVEILIGKRIVWLLTVCLRREILIEVIKNCPECSDRNWPMTDTQRWLEISRITKIKCIREMLTTRNYLPESITQSINKNNSLNFVMSSKKLFEHYLEKYPIDEKMDKKARTILINNIMWMAFEAKDGELIKKLYSESKRRSLNKKFENYLLYEGIKRKYMWELIYYMIVFKKLSNRAVNKFLRFIKF